MTVLGRLAALGIILWLVFGVIFPALDRANRMEEVGGVRSDGPVHATAGGLVVGVDSTGVAFAFDSATNSLHALIDGLERPLAADLAADGTACAVDQVATNGTLALRCSNGMNIGVMPPEDAAPGGGQPASRADVVADGRGGWLVADPSSNTVIRIDRSGNQMVAARFESCQSFLAPAPVGLAVDESGTTYIALLGQGASTVGEEIVQRCGPFIYLGDDDVIALIPRQPIPIALTRAGGTGAGSLAWHPGGDAPHFVILDGIRDPRGAALLPDGRIAISANGKLTLHQPESLPGS